MIETYVIHERPFNDAKKYLLLFSKDLGISSISITNKKNILYFTPYQALQKRRSLSLQEPISLQSPFMGQSLYCALYLNELIYRFCKPHDPHPLLFDHYQQSLSLLRQNANTNVVLRYFELNLLKEAGYGIDIESIRKPFVYFNKHQGFIGASDPSEHTIATVHLLNMLQKQSVSKEIKVFFRQILNSLLSSSLQARLFYEKVT